MLDVMGPAFLVSVAYLDPGNWATAIEAGSRFGYRLVWVVVASNLVAILLQTLSARLGICTGKHLAQVCRESYPPAVIWILWATCEISIVALDLTMLLGTAVGLNLLLGWPLLPCILLTGLDVVLLLLLVPHKGAIKKSEALTVGLLAIVVACFLVDLMVSKPPVSKLVGGLLPTMGREHLYTAVSLLGANVMPHSFYLHSALVSDQARLAAGSVKINPTILSRLCFLNFCDISCALAVALVVNVSVLLVSAATFYSRGITVETFQDAHDVMERILSSNVAPHAFGMALLCAGQLSTFTGTISGQVVLQGFLNVHISTWARRLITRSAAILPAAILQYVWGDRATYKFLLIAQVALALQLPVTLVPMIKATSSRQWMGSFRNSWLLALCAWSSLGLIFIANLLLLISQMVTGVEAHTPQLQAVEAHPFIGHGLDAAWLGLEPDGPIDLFLDDVLALAWHNPLRFVGLLLLVVTGAVFLALQLWMIITPLPGPAQGPKGTHGGAIPSMLSEQYCLTGGVDDEDDGTSLHKGGNSFSNSRQLGSYGLEEEEPKESWYQGFPDCPKGHVQDEEQAIVQEGATKGHNSTKGHADPIQMAWHLPPAKDHVHQSSHEPVPVSAAAGARAAAAAAAAQPKGRVGRGGNLQAAAPGVPAKGEVRNGSLAAAAHEGGKEGLTAVPGGVLYPSEAGRPLELGALDTSSMPSNAVKLESGCPQHQQQLQRLHQHHPHYQHHPQYQLRYAQQGLANGHPMLPRSQPSPPPFLQNHHPQHHANQQLYRPPHTYVQNPQQQHHQPLQQHHLSHERSSQTGPASVAGSNSSCVSRAGLSRGARRQVAACLEDFFGQYYSAHGQYQCARVSGATAGSRGPSQQGNTPLLCLHTHMSHLCTACAQDLYLAVRNCLKALEVLEAASPGLLPDPENVMDFLTRPLMSPAPAATHALAWHEAAVACLRLDDPIGMARLCARLYTSKLDDSRLLAVMPLDSASPSFDQDSLDPSALPALSTQHPHHPHQQLSHHQLRHHQQQQQQPGLSQQGVLGTGEGEGDDPVTGCSPALLNPEPRRALLSQISRMIGFEQPPAMNQWCLVGPASFLSFGLWSLSLMVSLCQHEARPQLWGRYAMVLNKQQGLLRDARLEVSTPTAGSGTNLSNSSSPHPAANGGSSGGGLGGHEGSTGSVGQQQLGSSGFMQLPPTATQLDSRHLATLRLELARQLQLLEIALADRRGPPGTVAGEVAYPKGKEIMQSVIKRLRRRLGYAHGRTPHG